MPGMIPGKDQEQRQIRLNWATLEGIIGRCVLEEPPPPFSRTHRQHCAFTQHQVAELVWDSLQPLGQCRSLVGKDAISEQQAKRTALGKPKNSPWQTQVSLLTMAPQASFPNLGPSRPSSLYMAFNTDLPEPPSVLTLCPWAPPAFHTPPLLPHRQLPSARSPIPPVARRSPSDYSPASIHPPTVPCSALYVATPPSPFPLGPGADRR